jgi:hypothetical protein
MQIASINPSRFPVRLFASALTAGLACAGAAHANVLNNPGFETPVTTSASNALNNFPGVQGVWGPEVGAITTATGGVTPASGIRMLGMTDDGLSYTQAFQSVDVSSFAALINSGNAQLNAGALFNVGGGFTGAYAAVTVQFFTGSTYSSLIGNSGTGALTLDANPQTWENIAVASAIPVGTTWMVYQVAYQNASIGTNTGFVDDAYLTITQVPAPGALAALGLAGLAANRRRR